MARLQPFRSSSSGNLSGFVESFGDDIALTADGSLVAYSTARVITDFSLGLDNFEDGIVIEGGQSAVFGVPCEPVFPTCRGNLLSSSTADSGEFDELLTFEEDIIVDFSGTAESVFGPVQVGGMPAPPLVVDPDLSADGTTLAFARSGQIIVVDLAAGAEATPLIASSARTEPVPLGGEGGGHGTSSDPSLSRDGELLAFATPAEDLLDAAGPVGRRAEKQVREDSAVSGTQVLLKDLSTGLLSLVSADRRGRAGEGPSGSPDLSGNGRLVVFESEAENLVRRDGNGVSDVFVKNLKSGQIKLVSADRRKDPGNGPSNDPSLAQGARFVAFTSTADDLVRGDLNEAPDVFVKDLRNGRIRLASIDADGNQLGGHGPSISGNGRYVVFLSDPLVDTGATGVVTNGFVKDMATGALAPLELNELDAIDNTLLTLALEAVEISADGGTIAFLEDARGYSIPDGLSEPDSERAAEEIEAIFIEDDQFFSRDVIGVTTNPLLDGEPPEASLQVEDAAFDLAAVLPGARGLTSAATEAVALQEGGIGAHQLALDHSAVL